MAPPHYVDVTLIQDEDNNEQNDKSKSSLSQIPWDIWLKSIYDMKDVTVMFDQK